MSTNGSRDGPTSCVELIVGGMGCRHAVRSVTARLRDVGGVETVVADPWTGLVTVTGTMSVVELLAALEDSPYRAAACMPGHEVRPA